MKRPSYYRAGFTLVELLVVLGGIGVLMGLLLPAVQMIRESARRVTCQNNLRQLGVAVLDHESAAGSLPLGATFQTGHSWITHILPQLEGQNLIGKLHTGVAWDDDINRPAATLELPVARCPTSSHKDYRGSTDYCGISGSSIGSAGDDEMNNGLFFTAASRLDRGIELSSIFDGLSCTIAVAEGAAVTDLNFGYWACGWHCFTHDDGGVNNRDGGYNEIASLHPGGANAALADGSVHFLGESIQMEIIGALCTRNGNELVGEFLAD